MSATTLTHRPVAADAPTALRRLVAECVLEAAEANGTAVARWMAAVDRLHAAVAHLEHLRRVGASPDERCSAGDEVSLALLRVISVYDDAQARLEVALADRPELLAARLDIAARSTDVMDAVLHGSLADRVCAILEARTPQVVTL